MNGHPALDGNFFEIFHFFGPRILFSLICGGLIGFERELKHKAAGIKTNMLICMGSCLYTSVSVLIAQTNSDTGHFGDPGRVAAQIVSGIGFIGGGAIIKERGTILGVTTAATIWLVAAIGLTIGLGYINIAVLVSILTVLVLVATTSFEDRIFGRYVTFSCEILAEDADGTVRQSVNKALEQNELNLEDFDILPSADKSLLRIKYRGYVRDHKKFILELWRTPGIKEVKQI